MDAIFEILRNLTTYVQGAFRSIPLVIVVLLVVALVVMLITIILTILAMRRASYKKAKAEKKEKTPGAVKAEEDEPYKLPPIGGWVSEYLSRKGYVKVSTLSLSFLRALEFLKESIKNYNYKYHLPWYMMVGASDCGKTTLIEGGEVNLPLGRQSFGIDAENPECRWWFLNRGVLLDVRGDLFLSQKDANSDEQGWRSLMVLLSRYRSARPLNGLILCIPATELYGKEKLTQDELMARANHVSNKLLMVQRSLGLRLPLYVVITKTDVVPGFQSFCSEIPTRNRQNILGWSCPFTPETLYTHRWIEEAFASIEENINDLRLEILDQEKITSARDGVFVFPNELLSLQSNLAFYLNQIFKTDSYNEQMLLRGIYFTGDSGITSVKAIFNDDDQAEDLSSGDEGLTIGAQLEAKVKEEEAKRKVFFINDLLQEKICREIGLSVPLQKKLMTANRAINVAKVSTAAFVLTSSYGLFNAYDNFAQRRDYILPVLSKMNVLLRDMQGMKLNQPGQSVDTFDSYARQLIEMMDQLHKTSFFSVFVPASWFSKLQRDLNRTLRVSYQQVIVRTVYIDLLLKARDLLHIRPTLENKSRSLAQLLKPGNSAEFHFVKKYVDDLVKLEDHINKFNNLRFTADAHDLEALVQYTFGSHLPDRFVDQFKKFRSLLKSTPFPPIDLKPYRELARQTLNVLYQNFLNAVSSSTDPYSLPSQLIRTIQRLSQNDVNQLPTIEELRKISTDLSDVIPTLGEPGKTWLDAPYFNPGKEFDAFFDQIDAHKLFGRDVTQFLVDQTAIAFDNLKLQLSTLSHVLVDEPIFAAGVPLKPGEPAKPQKPSLSKGLSNLEKSLSALFAQPYMAAPSGQRVVTYVPAGKIVYWDDRLIQMASDLCRAFDEINTKGLNTFPPVIRESMMYVARKSLQENVLSLVARAQSFVDLPSNMSESLAAEEILRSKITDVREISPKFIKLLELLNKDSLGTGFVELRALLCQTSYWLLGQVDKMMKSMDPYVIHSQNYNWWDGKPGAALAGYSVRDLQDLRTYVTLQRQQIQTITLDYAQPLVNFLSSSVMIDEPKADKTLLNKWRRIVEQIEAYGKKQPGNSVAQLEDFIIQDLNTLDIKNIFQKIKMEGVTNPSGDYFLEIMRQIKLSMLARAEIIKRKQGIENYKQLVTYFNEKLRNQFPFVSYVNLTMKEVSPEVIREFFRLYDEAGGSSKEILDQVYQVSAEVGACMQFLILMDGVKEFLQTYLKGHGDHDLPTFEFNMDFRANRDREKGGDLIVDWTFKPDEDTVVNKNDKARQGRWVYGNPVEVSFRWPSGDTIPEKPFADSQQPSLTVNERTASFRYTGRWSLLWLLKMHGTPKGEYFIAKDPNPYMLKFSIPLGEGSKSTVYNVITLLAPATNPKAPGKAIQIPDFPANAPDLPDVVNKYVDQAVLTEGLVKAEALPPKSAELAGKIEKTAQEEKAAAASLAGPATPPAAATPPAGAPAASQSP